MGTRPDPFTFTPMGVNSISFGSPHVRPTGRTCGEPNEIRKIPTRRILPALFREQAKEQAGAKALTEAMAAAAVAADEKDKQAMAALRLEVEAMKGQLASTATDHTMHEAGQRAVNKRGRGAGIFLDVETPPTRTPHGGASHVQMGNRNRLT